MYRLGYDVGGTKIEAALLKDTQNSYEIVTRLRTPTEREKGYAAILEKMRDLYLEICEALPAGETISSVGIGLPGAVDPKIHKMLNGNTSAFVGKELIEDFRKIFSPIPQIRCANDANCFALAEVLHGAGRIYEKETGKTIKEQFAIGIILGTGCGAGVVYCGKFIEGRNGGTGEIGHSQLVTNGRECFCGQKGCAETYISGTGMLTTYEEISGRRHISGAEVFGLAERGDQMALKSIEIYKAQLIQFLGNITNILDPDYFVLGGGVSLQNYLYLDMPQKLKPHLFLPIEPPRIYQNQLGDSAGVIGAAFL